MRFPSENSTWLLHREDLSYKPLDKLRKLEGEGVSRNLRISEAVTKGSALFPTLPRYSWKDYSPSASCTPACQQPPKIHISAQRDVRESTVSTLNLTLCLSKPFHEAVAAQGDVPASLVRPVRCRGRS